MNALSISNKYPVSDYNLLGNTDVMVEVPDIKSPVIQVISLDPDPEKGDVYIHQKAKKEYRDKNKEFHPATPAQYAITKNGLKKLADGAGIKMILSEHVIPTTCQKCVAVNRNSGKVVQCGNCSNRDVAYHVSISVPQLTGEILTVDDTHEIIVENTTPGMSDKQKAEFMKHLPQICEAKALNGAIRTALHIKGTYLLEEIMKPFVVAYLVPNLNHNEVKRAAIENMFLSSSRLFGSAPSVQQIETKVPEHSAIEAADGENFDSYIDGTYKEEAVEEPEEVEDQERDDWYCDKCGAHINEKIWTYSFDNFGTPLCHKCQKLVKDQQEQKGAGYQCYGCGTTINEKVYKYSLDKYGRPLCMKCQKGANR